jgi:hypothetical protein
MKQRRFLPQVADDVARKAVFRVDRQGWCIERGLYCCCGYAFYAVNWKESVWARLMRLWRFLSSRSPSPPIPSWRLEHDS